VSQDCSSAAVIVSDRWVRRDSKNSADGGDASATSESGRTGVPTEEKDELGTSLGSNLVGESVASWLETTSASAANNTLATTASSTSAVEKLDSLVYTTSSSHELVESLSPSSSTEDDMPSTVHHTSQQPSESATAANQEAAQPVVTSAKGGGPQIGSSSAKSRIGVIGPNATPRKQVPPQLAYLRKKLGSGTSMTPMYVRHTETQDVKKALKSNVLAV
jgi:hypothetical protein